MAFEEALALIPQFGRTVVLVQLASTIPDPAQPWRGPVDPRSGATTLSTAAVFIPLSGANALGLSQETRDLAKKAMATAIIAVDASPYQELLDGATRYKITKAEILKPGDILYVSFLVLNQ